MRNVLLLMLGALVLGAQACGSDSSEAAPTRGYTDPGPMVLLDAGAADVLPGAGGEVRPADAQAAPDAVPGADADLWVQLNALPSCQGVSSSSPPSNCADYGDAGANAVCGTRAGLLNGGAMPTPLPCTNVFEGACPRPWVPGGFCKLPIGVYVNSCEECPR